MKYTVKPTAQFKQDYRQALRRGEDMAPLDAAISALAEGETLPQEARDRALMGPWAGHRECRVGPNRLLIYRIQGELLVLTLTRTGTPAALYEKGGVNAMKKSTSLRMLLRSPVKTAVTLLLIAAASFLFLYNLLDYAMTRRNYDRTYSQYHGYFSVMHQEDQLAEARGMAFFLSDPKSNPAWAGNLPYELYHTRTLTAEELETLSALPYVTRMEQRYMTGGLADFRRIYVYRSLLTGINVNNTKRVVIEGTYNGSNLDLSVLNPEMLYGIDVDLRLDDVKVLAGDEEDLKQCRSYIDKKRLCVEAFATFPERADNRPDWIYGGGTINGYTKNWVNADMLMDLELGRRYVFVATVNVQQVNSSGILDEEHFWTMPYTLLGDDSLYGLCDYVTPVPEGVDDYLETEEFAGLRRMMEIIETDKYTLDIHYLEDMASLKRYQDGQFQLAQGRILGLEDMGKPVCVIPEGMAQEYGLRLGDSFHLRLGDKLLEPLCTFGAVAYSDLRYAENWTDQTFTVVGTYTESSLDRVSSEERFWAYGDNAVFVPLSFLPETADTANHEVKPTEVSFLIEDADSIIPFRDEVLPRLLDMGYIVRFSDGGWPAVREQLTQAGGLTLVKLVAFTVSAVLVLLLTVYLYILRKKKEFAVMRALGCPAGEAKKALLFPLFALAVPAVLLGSVGAVVYTRYAASANAAEFAALGLTMDAAIPVSILLAGFCGSLVLLLILAWAALARVAHLPPLELLQGSVNRNAGKRKELPPELAESVELAPLPVLEPPVYHKHTGPAHTLRYVWKRLRRTPVKALLSMGLALVLCFSIGFFALLRNTYRDLYQNIEVHPRFLNGFSYNRALEVEKSGYVRDPYYEYINRNVESNFVQDTLILTSDISRATDAEITWREDKGPEMFKENKSFCVVSRELADELGYTLGSRCEVCGSGYLYTLQASYPELTRQELIDEVYHKATRHLTVAGIAEEEGKRVYAAAAAWECLGSMFSDYLPLDKAEYTLVDYHMATQFRSWVFRLLVGRPGSFSLDTSEADRVYQTYRLLELLYPIAFALALILGGVLPAGVILQSAKEASLLRVLGTTKRRTRAMLTLEQIFLCLLGLGLAVAALVIARGSALAAVAGLIAVYTAAHLLSCAVGTEAAAVSVTRRNVLELLQVKE